MSAVQLNDIEMIGENHHGYKFGIGKLNQNDEWQGFAFGENGEAMCLFLFPHATDSDHDRCLRLTVATAQHPPHGYGGITDWYMLDESLRFLDIAKYVCPMCDEVGCDGCF